MISYEVTLEIDPTVADRLDDHMLDTHIKDVLATGWFTSAVYFRDGDRRRTVYESADQASLDAYLANDADRLRADFAVQFPAGVSAGREVWTAVCRFEVP